jgi:hypothetical protein
MKIHTAADLFPMMNDDELQELAADIAANGLLHPIIIDAEKQLIDGRNRLAACKIAQVEPRFEQLNGHDPLAYIVSANLARRNLTKGQQAMALAMMYPNPEKGGRGKNVEARKAQVSWGFSAERVRQARSVFRHSQDLAQSVIKGSVSLDEALRKVDELKQQANSTEAKLARPQKAAPDLAARVAQENLSLNEALAILDQRELELRRTKEAGHTAARDIFHFCPVVGADVCGVINVPLSVRRKDGDASMGPGLRRAGSASLP